MWRNYLTVGLRALTKNRTYAFINIFGLAIGLAACLMALLYVRHETSYDAWIPGSGNIYQLQTDFVPQENGQDLNLQMAPYAAGQALANAFPQVEGVTFLFANTPTVIHRGQAFNIENGVMVGPGFLDVLPLPLVRGDPKNALSQVGTVILSETEATRFFGDEDPVGKTLTIMTNGAPIDHRVTGVMKNPPANSHLDLSMAVRFDPATALSDMPELLTNFDSVAGWVYVRLKPGTDPDVIRAQMPAWEERTIPGEGLDDLAAQLDFRLVNITDVHLGPAQQGAMKPGNDPVTIITFGLIAALILGMAIVNYTNLATARANQRAREVALRKVLGASRKQLVAQFLGESVLLTTVGMLIALALAELGAGALSSFLGIDLAFHYWGPSGLLGPVALLLLTVGVAGGIYPALFLSRYQPAQILRANKSSPEAAGTGRLRAGLVVAQFATSIALIICTIIVFSQTAHVREINPGYNRYGLIQIADTDAEAIGSGDRLRAELERIPGVTAVAGTNQGIATEHRITTEVELPGRSSGVEVGSHSVGYDYFKTMEIDLLAGRLFDVNRTADDATPPPATGGNADRGVNVVVNELAAKRMGFATPADAVGKQVRAPLPEWKAESVPLTIVGVVEDSRFDSARDPVRPIIFHTSRSALPWVMVRYEDAEPSKVRAAVAAVWQRLVPEVSFSARFSEDIIGELYQAEDKRAKLFAGFALLAIVIACLGLFGLAAFTAERRTKEIGIRKVFGARVRDIVRLLAWQFSKPVILANLMAWPIAWWVMRDWLNRFDERVALTPTPFVFAALLALGIAIGTVSGHAVRVARANPIHALRYE
jgi:putative ABC transport system permease protein